MSEKSTSGNDLYHEGMDQKESSVHFSSGNFAIVKGQIIHDTLEKRSYRILYIPGQNLKDDQEGAVQKGYWICTDRTDNIPKAFDLGEIRKRLQNFRYIPVPDNFPCTDHAGISKAAQKRMDQAYALIAEIVNMEPDIYDRSRRSDLLEETAKKNSISIRSLYSYLGKYWRGGMVKEALLPAFSRIGTGRKEDFVPKRRLGRPCTRQGQNGKILTGTDFQNFRRYAENLSLSGRRPRLREVYDNMLADCYSHPRSEGDTAPAPLPPEERPSYMQFYYWVRKNRDRVDTVCGRPGENTFSGCEALVTEKGISESASYTGASTEESGKDQGTHECHGDPDRIPDPASARSTDDVLNDYIEAFLKEEGFLTDDD